MYYSKIDRKVNENKIRVANQYVQIPLLAAKLSIRTAIQKKKI